MNTPSVSIIIPVYNQEKWVGRCLRSLINQTMDRDQYEIIVVNDGSTDRTGYALKLFEDEIILINNKENKGLPASLNIGIKESRANHIVRVDADDYVNEFFLFLLHEFLLLNNYMDAVSCDYFLIDDQENILERKDCIKDPVGCGIMFKSAHLFEIGLYDEDFQLWEEKELRHLFEKKYQIHRLELPLYRYRRHNNNITNNKESDILHTQKLKNKHGI